MVTYETVTLDVQASHVIASLWAELRDSCTEIFVSFKVLESI